MTDTLIHHPSCPARGSTEACCLCGPEAAAEDLLILMERSPDTMLLDIVAHADLATLDQPLLAGPIGRRLAIQLGLR